MSAQFIASTITINLIIPLILLSVAYCILLERKIAAWVQDRIGPNRTNFSFGILPIRHHCWGLGQPLADGLKMLLKEDYTPPGTDRKLFRLAPVLAIIPALISWAVVPWGGYMTWGDQQVLIAAAPINIGVIYILAVGSLSMYGVVVGGYASNNKYSFLGGLRATAQMLSYEIPMGLCVLMALLVLRTPHAGLIVESQANAVWIVCYQPLIAVIFFICMLAEANRAPFDLPECEQELVGGFHTEYSSMKFAMFYLGEYIHMIAASAFLVLLFFGGWDLPLIPEPGVGQAAGIGWVLYKAVVFAGKIFLVMSMMMMVRWTLPRFRFDQLMKLAWRSLIPLCLAMLLITGAVIYLKLSLWTLTLANVVVVLAVPFVARLLPQGPPVNRRIGLEGSRFSPPEAT